MNQFSVTGIVSLVAQWDGDLQPLENGEWVLNKPRWGRGWKEGGCFGNKGRALGLVAMEGGRGGRSRFTSVWRLLVSLKAAGCTCGRLQGGEGPPRLPALGMAGRALCGHGGLVLPAAAGPPSCSPQVAQVAKRLVPVVNKENRRGRRSGRPPCPSSVATVAANTAGTAAQVCATPSPSRVPSLPGGPLSDPCPAVLPRAPHGSCRGLQLPPLLHGVRLRAAAAGAPGEAVPWDPGGQQLPWPRGGPAARGGGSGHGKEAAGQLGGVERGLVRGVRGWDRDGCWAGMCMGEETGSQPPWLDPA